MTEVSHRGNREMFHLEVQEIISSYWKGCADEWEASSGPQKGLIVAQIVLTGLLVGALLIGACLDSTGLIGHLMVFSLIVLVQSFLHNRLEELLSARFFGAATDAKTDSEVGEDSATSSASKKKSTWKGHAALFLFYLAASYIPITGIPKGIISIFVLCAFYQLGTFIFNDIYSEAYLVLATLGSFVIFFFDLMHWLPSLPIFLTLLVWTLRSFYRADVKHADRPKSSKVRAVSTVVSVITAGICLGACIPWIFLNTNASWVFDHDYSKFQVIHHFPPETSLNVHLVKSLSDIALYSGGFSRPLVIKPNVCTYASRGVRVCRDYQCLRDYVSDGLATKPKGFSWIIQDYCNHEEAVIFYYRYPYLRKGFIKMIGIRAKAKSTDKGNGTQALVAAFRPTRYHEPTKEITEFFDRLADMVPGFTGARYDVIMEEGIQGALQGKGIRVLEAETFFVDSMEETRRGEDSFIQDAIMSVKWCRTMALEYWAGVANILVGNQANIFLLFSRVPFLYRSHEMCHQSQSIQNT